MEGAHNIEKDIGQKFCREKGHFVLGNDDYNLVAEVDKPKQI